MARPLKMKTCPQCQGRRQVVVESVFGFSPVYGPCPTCQTVPRKTSSKARKRRAKPRPPLAPDNNPPTTLTLPWPPSVNTYWRAVNGRNILSKRGREYRQSVLNLFTKRPRTRTGTLSVRILFEPPDLRRRDIDNLPKGCLDALTHAGVYADDSQIRHLDLRFGDVVPGGRVTVTISPFVR